MNKFDALCEEVMSEGIGKVMAGALLAGSMLGNPSTSSASQTQSEYVSSDYNTIAKEMIERHEGIADTLYYVNDIPHIGIGFNLERSDARKLLDGNTVDFDAVMRGEKIPDSYIFALFRLTYSEAVTIAKKFCPNFDSHPEEVKAVIVDMAFNMNNSLYKFKNMRKALKRKDYKSVANEMKDSKWFNQVGNRSVELVNIMKRHGG